MDTKIKLVNTIDHVNFYFDTLRDKESFLVLGKNNVIQMGFLSEDKALLEPNMNLQWDQISGVITGVNDFEKFERIKRAIHEKNQ